MAHLLAGVISLANRATIAATITVSNNAKARTAPILIGPARYKAIGGAMIAPIIIAVKIIIPKVASTTFITFH